MAIELAITLGLIAQHNANKQAAIDAEDNARLQQRQMEYNQRMENREAAAQEAETAENARRMREEAAKLRSAQIAALGKSGAALSAGSPLAILGETAAAQEMKVQDLHYSGARAAATHKIKAADYGFGAAIARQNAFAARKSRPSSASLALNIGSAMLEQANKGVTMVAGIKGR